MIYMMDDYRRAEQLAKDRELDILARQYFPRLFEERGMGIGQGDEHGDGRGDGQGDGQGDRHGTQASEGKRKRSEETGVLWIDERGEDPASSTTPGENLRGSRAQPVARARRTRKGKRTRRQLEALDADKENVGRDSPRVSKRKSSKRDLSCAELRADAKTMRVPTEVGKLARRDLLRVIIDHIPVMTVAQLVTMCDKKRLSLDKRRPRKIDYVALLVSHYE